MRLHLGCGKKILRGFTHIDISEFSHIDFVSSLGNLNFLPPSSVTEIYCSHALEYYDQIEVLEVLKEWFRVLMPGGQVYIAVPDLKALIAIYELSGSIENILGPLFGRWATDTGYIYHKTAWDFQSLGNTLSGIGFNLVREFDPVEYLSRIDSEYDDYSLAYYPHLNREGIKVSITINATKPTNL